MTQYAKPNYGDLKRVELGRELATPELDYWHTVKEIPELSLTGQVVHGFNRGSKELGIPTANIEMTDENLDKLKHQCLGVYVGWVEFIKDVPEQTGAIVGEKFKAAMNIGYCPKYDNKEKTAEVYFLHEFPTDFYGSTISVKSSHFLRSEIDPAGLDYLIMAI